MPTTNWCQPLLNLKYSVSSKKKKIQTSSRDRKIIQLLPYIFLYLFGLGSCTKLIHWPQMIYIAEKKLNYLIAVS